MTRLPNTREGRKGSETPAARPDRLKTVGADLLTLCGAGLIFWGLWLLSGLGAAIVTLGVIMLGIGLWGALR